MPLIKSGNKKAISTNIREMMAAGYPQKQAVAAALDTARRYSKRYAEGGSADEDKYASLPASERIEDRRGAPTEGDLVDQANLAAADRLMMGTIGRGYKSPGAKALIRQIKRSKDDNERPKYGRKYAGGGEIDEALAAEEARNAAAARLAAGIHRQPRLGPAPGDAAMGVIAQGLAHEFGTPGRTFSGEGAVKYATPGKITEEESYLEDINSKARANWGASMGMNTVGMGRLPGAAPPGAIGAGGGQPPLKPPVIQYLLDKGYPQKVINSMPLAEKFEVAKSLGYQPPLQPQKAAPVQVPSASEAEAFLKSKGLYTITNPEVAAINHGWKPGWKEPSVGSQDWFSGEFSNILKGKEPSPKFNDSLEQQFADFVKTNVKGKSANEHHAANLKAMDEPPIKGHEYDPYAGVHESDEVYTASGAPTGLKHGEPPDGIRSPDDVSDAVKAIQPEKHSPEGWDRIIAQEKEAKGGVPIEQELSKTMLDDLVDGVKPNKVAQYLFEFAKKGDIETALAAKSLLPKQAKADINAALWGLTKSKKMSLDDKAIVNELFISKAKPKPVNKQNINDAEDFLKALGHNQFDESEKHLFANPVKWAKAAGWDGKPLKPAPGWSKEDWVQLNTDQKQHILANPYEQIPYPWTAKEWAQFSPEQKKAVLTEKPQVQAIDKSAGSAWEKKQIAESRAKIDDPYEPQGWQRGQTRGVTPEEIEQYLNAQEAHDIGPQWEPPKPKQGPAKTAQKPAENLAERELQPAGDPEIPLPTYEFENHPSPFPRLEAQMTYEKLKKAKQWELNQPGYHGTKTDVLFNEFKLPEEIPYGDGTHRRPQLGVHFGTSSAAHNIMGPAHTKTWETINNNSWHHDNTPYRIFQTLIKAKRPLDLPDLGTWRPADIAQGLRSHSRIPHKEIEEAMKNTKSAGSWEREVIQMRSLRNLLDKHGYDSVRYVNNAEDQGSVSFIKWNLNEIRSPHAKFKDRMSKDLLGAIAAGLIIPHYGMSDEKEDKMKKGGRTPMAAGGGFQPSRWLPRPPKFGLRPIGQAPARSHVGAIRSAVPGRTDKLPMNVRGGSYVIPASVVSGMAQGNTLAGFDALDKMFNQGPYGMKMRAPGAAPRVNFGKMGSMPRMPRMAQDGGEMGGGEDVPIIAAGGEYIISPEAVRRVGGGDIKHGHEILDQFVMQIRKQTIHDMRREKPPKK